MANFIQKQLFSLKDLEKELLIIFQKALTEVWKKANQNLPLFQAVINNKLENFSISLAELEHNQN